MRDLSNISVPHVQLLLNWTEITAFSTYIGVFVGIHQKVWSGLTRNKLMLLPRLLIINKHMLIIWEFVECTRSISNNIWAWIVDARIWIGFKLRVLRALIKFNGWGRNLKTPFWLSCRQIRWTDVQILKIDKCSHVFLFVCFFFLKD